jgi:hypothetical protein
MPHVTLTIVAVMPAACSEARNAAVPAMSSSRGRLEHRQRGQHAIDDLQIRRVGDTFAS